MNKRRNSMITLASASVLLGLISVANTSQTVKADDINTQLTTNNNLNNTPTDLNTINDNQSNSENQTENTSTENDNQEEVNNVSDINSSSLTLDSKYTFLTNQTQVEQNIQLNQRTVQALQDANIQVDSLNNEQVKKLSQINFDNYNLDTGTQFTYSQYRSLAHKMINRDKQYRVPYFNAKKIKNMRATRTRDAQTGKVANLDIWDSWVVQDEKTGKVVNYKGYQIAIAMMGIPKHNDSHIYLLYNKYNDNNLNHWKTAGPIFGFHASKYHQEWSGSATVNKDGSIQLFYTDVDTRQGDNHQKISTVNLKLAIDKKGHVKIAKRKNRHVLFEGDGYHYQTYDQWKAKNKGADNVAMRDAHVISVDGKRYLIFEASTGDENYQGEDQIYNWQNYGGTDAEAIKNFLAITADEDMTSRASWANAAIGIVSLDDNENNPNVDEVLTPLITSPMVSDEIERPDVLKLNGKYYLFATTRLNRGTGDDLWKKANIEIGDNVAMMGWVSDHLTYGYEPLNGDSTILTASVPFNWRTSTYSYYAVPVAGHDDEVLITSYMTNRGYAAGAGKRSTWSPSFLVKINDDNTTEVLNKATNQGDWVYDKNSANPSMIVSSIKQARLKGEPDPDKSGKLSKIPLKKKKAHKKHRKVIHKKHTKKAKKAHKSILKKFKRRSR